MHSSSPNNGFTLIELSIVLVIIGLLAGGVLTGQTLIRAAEIRSVYTEKEKFMIAMQTFRLKYKCIAGDCGSATDFFGSDPEGCPAGTTIKTPKTQTCNGNGNGRIDGDETFTIWQHLSGAGLIPGIYRGSYANNNNNGIRDIDSSVWMPLKISANHFWFIDTASPGNDSILANGSINNQPVMFSLPASWGNTLNDLWVQEGILTPQEMFSFDQKYDDGKPATGNIQSPQETLASGLSLNCTTQPFAPPAQVANPSAITYNFVTSPTEKVCKVAFLNLGF